MATGGPGPRHEDRILAETAWPVAARIGTSLVALALSVASAGAFLAVPDGDDRLSASLVLVAAVPWALDVVGVVLRFERFAIFVLTPLAALTAVCMLGVVDADSLGSQLSLFPLLVLAVVAVVTATRRVALTVGGAVYLVLLGRTISGGWVDLGPWHVAVVLVVAAAFAVRMLVVSMVEVREAREALARQAIADERRRIVRDVHDVVAHTLAVTLVNITAARMALRRSSPEAAVDALQEAERYGRASLADVRRIVRLLRMEPSPTVESPQPGLADVEDLVAGYRAAGLPVEMAVTSPPEGISPVAGLVVYRALQEALANAARHGSGPAEVELRIEDGDLVLRVDNPLALPADAERGGAVPSPPTARGRGSGLAGMEERVAAVGGTVEAGPSDGRWTVAARVPLDA